MMKIAKFVLPVIAAGFMATSAQASMVFHNTVTTSGNWVINTLTIDTDTDLTAVGAHTALGTGMISQLAMAPFFPDPNAIATVGYDLGALDSYVSINGTAPSVTASGGAKVGGGDVKLFNQSTIDLTWGEESVLTDIGNGLFIARLVFANTANGEFQMVATNAGTPTAYRSQYTAVVNGVLVPEPASMSLLALGGLALLRRR